MCALHLTEPSCNGTARPRGRLPGWFCNNIKSHRAVAALCLSIHPSIHLTVGTAWKILTPTLLLAPTPALNLDPFSNALLEYLPSRNESFLARFVCWSSGLKLRVIKKNAENIAVSCASKNNPSGSSYKCLSVSSG